MLKQKYINTKIVILKCRLKDHTDAFQVGCMWADCPPQTLYIRGCVLSRAVWLGGCMLRCVVLEITLCQMNSDFTNHNVLLVSIKPTQHFYAMSFPYAIVQ